MDTLSCTAELKPSMTKLKDNRHGTTRSAEQYSLMTTINEEDRTLGLTITRISVSNPDTKTRTTRQPIDKMASTLIGTEIQIHIDSTLKTDRVILGPMDPTTVSRLSITSMLDRRILILSTKKTFHRATICLHPTQFSSSTTRDKM